MKLISKAQCALTHCNFVLAQWLTNGGDLARAKSSFRSSPSRLRGLKRWDERRWGIGNKPQNRRVYTEDPVAPRPSSHLLSPLKGCDASLQCLQVLKRYASSAQLQAQSGTFLNGLLLYRFTCSTSLKFLLSLRAPQNRYLQLRRAGHWMGQASHHFKNIR